SQTAMRFVGHIGYHDYEGPAVELDERERIVSDLGPHDALVMRNHGLLTCGATIQQAFNTMYQLELSCRSQVDAMAARTELALPAPGATMAGPPEPRMPGENLLPPTAPPLPPRPPPPVGVAGRPGIPPPPRPEGPPLGLSAVLALRLALALAPILPTALSIGL